jgi:hypothetical protein
MNVDRSQIVGILRARGLDARADWAERTLPEVVDTETNAGLLTTLSIDPRSLVPVEVARPDQARTDVTPHDD